MQVTPEHFFGIFATLLLVIIIGWLSGKKVITANDFAVSAKQSTSPLVAGTIMGTLVGGASTVGTAQLAFLFGFSAWWFTLGGGIACFILGVFLAKPLRQKNFETIPRFLQEAYGEKAAIIAVLFIAAGMFVNIIPQILSSTALFTSMFPLWPWLASLITVSLMVFYVFFGGIWGTGYIGITKIALTYISLMIGGVLALKMLGGIGGMVAAFPSHPWLNLFGRSVNDDLAAAISLLMGVLSSQIYFQAIFSARDLKSARNGALISTMLGPLIGLAAIVIGLFMQANHPEINASLALPLFVVWYLNPWFAGVVQATLLLTAIGTGAGLSLGLSTMLCRDVYQRLHPEADDTRVLHSFRLLIIAILALALLIAYIFGQNGLILQWSYMSLSIRGAAVFFPLMAALFIKRKVSHTTAILAVVAGPASVIFGGILVPWDVNPMYLGLFVSLFIIVSGYLRPGNKISLPNNQSE